MTDAKIRVFEKDYPACISTRLMVKVQQKTGKSFSEGLNDLLSGDNVEGMFWMLREMLIAGKQYRALLGEESPEVPTEDYMLDMLGLDDYRALAESIYNVALNTSKADVDIEDADEKN